MRLKKIFSLLIILFIFSLNSFSQPTQLTITGTNVNFRDTPSTAGKIVGKLNLQDIGEIIEKGKKETIGANTDYWYKIKCNNLTGWVFGTFTSLSIAPFTVPGTYDDFWYNEPTGDAGRTVQIIITKTNGVYSGTYTQGVPESTDGSDLPEKKISKTTVDEKNNSIAFEMEWCTKIEYIEGKEPNRIFETVQVKGFFCSKGLTIDLSGLSGFKRENLFLPKK